MYLLGFQRHFSCFSTQAKGIIMSNQDRRQFLKTAAFSAASALASGYGKKLFAANQGLTNSLHFNVGNKFSAAIFADPQVGPLGSQNRVAVNARRTQIQAVEEINKMRPMPLFAIWVGDLVNTFTDSSAANFEECIENADMQRLLVHGNHDTRAPFEPYKDLQERVNGMRDMFYSFDAGKWHFIVIPCNLYGNTVPEKETEKAMLDWLEKDLRANKDRPTMFFTHLHLVPQGLTQLEWYTFRLELRMKLLDLITERGNVKYVINGHVHNGIKASVKMSCIYKGTRFITSPTIIEGRNFGEEFAEYEQGLPVGGYYITADLEDEDVTLKGWLVGVEKPYVYPKDLRVFTRDIEPRWFERVIDFRPTDKLINGGFEKSGLDGWNATYRYIADEDPAFLWEATDRHSKSGSYSAYVQTKSKGRVFWARDDMTGLYQVVKVPQKGNPVLRASYFVENRPINGGGFIRFNAMTDNEFKYLTMCKWGSNKNKSDYLPRSVGYEIHGWQQNWAFLQQMGKQKRGMYWHMPDDPGQWYDLEINIRELYDRAHQQAGAFDKLGINKLFVQVGTWSNREQGSISGAYFDDVSLESSSANIISNLNGAELLINDWVFSTRFGQDLIDSEARREARRGGGFVDY